MYTVYWIRHKDHTDIFSQGYVGVSDNVDRRFKQHQRANYNPKLARSIKKYGWDNLVKSVVLIADEKYCYDVETKLRPEKQIGWNIVPGGVSPGIHAFPGKLNPMFGKKRPDLAERNRTVIKSGEDHGNFKGTIIATNTKTGKQMFLNGGKDQKQNGFNPAAISMCLSGKRKQHHGHTFTRIDKE